MLWWTYVFVSKGLEQISDVGKQGLKVRIKNQVASLYIHHSEHTFPKWEFLDIEEQWFNFMKWFDIIGLWFSDMCGLCK